MDEFKMFEKYIQEDKKPVHNTHIYSRSVRRALFSSALLMVVGLPFFETHIELPSFLAVLGIVVITFLAGFTNPQQKFIMILDVGIAVIGFFVFEVIAVNTYSIVHGLSYFFLFNQAVALLFFTACFFGAKTLRTFFLAENKYTGV